MPEFITKDFAWKLASVILAVGIWVTIFKYNSGGFEPNAAQPQNIYGDLPVAVFSSSGDPRTYKIAPQKVSVTVSGSAAAMNGLQGSEIRPFVDVSGKESAGSYRADVRVSLPKGVTLVAVDPSWVGVTAPGH
jgi:YbbR domain-containing protein